MEPTIRDFISGLSAGGATTLIMHPLDLIKVRLQVDAGSTHKYHIGYIPKLVQQITAQSPRGILELYRGIGPNLIGNTVSWGLYFTLYHKFVDNFADHSKQDGRQYMLCAMASGTVTSALTNPVWVLKTRMLSTSKADPGAYQSMLEGIRQIKLQDGLKGFWRGFVPGLMGVFQASIQFALYERFKQIQRTRSHIQYDNNGDSEGDRTNSKLSTVEYLSLSALSKIIATVGLYPYQVVRSRLQAYNKATASASNQRYYTSTWDVLSKVYRYEGMHGFYKGLIPNLFRVVPATCITFVVYENVKMAL